MVNYYDKSKLDKIYNIVCSERYAGIKEFYKEQGKRLLIYSVYYNGKRQILDRKTANEVVVDLFRKQMLLGIWKITVSQSKGNVLIKVYNI